MSISLHAMMTLNPCFESYGAAVHVMDSLAGVSTEHVRRSLRRFGGNRTSNQSAPSVSERSPIQADAPVDVSFAEHVRSAIEELPFEQAQAVWLVDVCRCGYDQASIEMAVPRQEFVCHLVAGRRSIRTSITTPLLVTPVG